ncbi:MAG TPA: DUF4340 domain-containing protein [Verrucomicrobiae bacterium]
MKSKTTAIWFVLAAALAAVIWYLNDFLPPAAPQEVHLFNGLHAGRITRLQITPGGGREISVLRTNHLWSLEKPFAYPAQPTAIDSLAAAMEKLTATATLSAAEMSRHKNADAEYGFDNPQFRVDVATADGVWHALVGFKTAPGDGVYVRIIGGTDVYVVDPAWLDLLPRDANVWRDTTLVEMPPTVDWLVITNGTQVIELRRNPTNRLWSMVYPLQTPADNLRIVTALQQLRTAKVSQFVSDDPKTDWTGYGLEPAALDIWLGYGTNMLTALHVGKDVAGASAQTYARRDGLNSVVATAKEPLLLWRGLVNDFRDPNLIELTAPVAEVEMRNGDNFTLQLRSNEWTVAGEKFAADQQEIQDYIKTLGNVRVADFVQDVVTGTGYQKYGLDNPSRQVTLRSVAGDTNSVIAQLQFGAISTNVVFAKRAREPFVYSVSLDELNRLSLPGDYFRDRHIWSFSETNVATVTVQQDGKARQMTRTGTNAWSLTAGQGIINPPAIEEVVHRLGDLNSYGWVGRKFNDENLQLTTNSLAVTIEMKSGEKHTVQFGRGVQVPSLTALAVVTLDGERWAFIFPPVLYPLIQENLAIPASNP